VENSNYQVSGMPAIITCAEYNEHKWNNRRMNGDETASQVNTSHNNPLQSGLNVQTNSRCFDGERNLVGSRNKCMEISI
jgi:hypothetical protein